MNLITINRVIAKTIVVNAVKDGKNITLFVATETSHWKRVNSAIEPVAAVLVSSLEGYKGPLPAGTTEVCVRYIICVYRLAEYKGTDTKPQRIQLYK